MRTRYILLLATILPFAANARWMTLKEAGAVIEKYSSTTDVKADGSYDQTIDYVARVQAEDAKANVSLFQIEYNSLEDTVEVLEAFTENGAAKIPVEASAIEDRDKGESKDYDVIKVRSVAFPQVQIGSKVHIRYRFHIKKAILENRWSNEYDFGPGTFVEKFALQVNSERPLHYDVEDPSSLLKVKLSRDARHLTISNRKLNQGWVQNEKEPFLHPVNLSRVSVSTMASWPEFFAPLDRDFTNVLKAPLPAAMKTVVAKVGKLANAKEQILSVMNFMSREFRYFGDWRRNQGGIVPRSLSEIEKSRYGDCKDLASLLAATLRALKIDADVALVRRGENPWGYEPDYRLPEVSRFNHAIVQARVGSEIYWLDATNPVASLEPIPDVAGRPAWILQPGRGHFARIPPAVSADYVHIRSYEYRFLKPGTVEVIADADLKHLAPYQTANSLLLQPRSEVLTNITEFFSEGQEVRSSRFLEEPQASRELKEMKIGLEYQAERVTFEAGKAAFFVIPDGMFNGPFYETESRATDIRLAPEPFMMDVSRRLKDVKLVQDRPAPCKVTSQWLSVEREIVPEGEDVVIKQKVNLIKPFITHAEYVTSEFKKLQQETKKCFYRSGILVESRHGAL